ncbi:zinc finger BED domain-containing protein 4-like [Aphis craccivora]|uniref:Zinc finger BED domain-containing protein 4-like n=1 Tax=Aphis craccivora TaxID=307492 RepID=A0A6G0W0U7_APHCR|nr:zinc finger BED domain-containing protein 4-like [Aphis craccivora]
MGTRSPEIQWPARSPDMTPLDFFFLGFVNNAVYEKMPSSKNELINKITEVCSNIPVYQNYQLNNIYNKYK